MEFVEVIEQHGVPIVISSVFIYGLVKGINFFDDAQRKKLKIESAEKHNELMDLRLTVTKRIKGELESMVYKTGASRGYLIEYHNGGEGLERLPFFKMSCKIDATNDGVQSFKSSFQDIDCSDYVLFLNKIDKNPYVIFDTDNPDKGIESSVYGSMVMQGMGKSVAVKVTGKKNRTIGIVGLDFNTGNDKIDELNIESLQDLAIKVGAWLTVK